MRPTLIDDASRATSKDIADRPNPDRVVSTRDLLAGAHRIWIEHAAERYLLQVTRNGKLILTK